jgi:hypothetical protein
MSSIILPLGVTVQTIPSPRFDLYVTQGEERPFAFTIVDANGNPFNLTGKSAQFSAFSNNGIALATAFHYNSPTNIVYSGVGSNTNIVTVTLQPADIATEEILEYQLWDLTDFLVLSHGKLEIGPGLHV